MYEEISYQSHRSFALLSIPDWRFFLAASVSAVAVTTIIATNSPVLGASTPILGMSTPILAASTPILGSVTNPSATSFILTNTLLTNVTTTTAVATNAIVTNIVVVSPTPGVSTNTTATNTNKPIPGLRFNKPGNILIADQFNNRVIEANTNGDIVWQYGLGPNDFTTKSIIGVNDAERVGSSTLMVGTGTPAGVISNAPDGAMDNRVILVGRNKKIQWQYGQFGVAGDGPNQLNVPVQATWVKGHKVIITDQGNNRVIEVDKKKNIIWEFPGSNTNASDQLNSPNSAELLQNGHVLIADLNNNRAIEVTTNDEIVQTFTAGGTVGPVAFASRLTNGDTLLTDSGNARAVEVDSNDTIVWQFVTDTQSNSISMPLPTRAVRLKNGDTLISDQFNNQVIRVDMDGNIVMAWGLPLADGNNVGYDTNTTQNGLFAPYDAKIIGDFTGLTPPNGFPKGK